MEHLPQAVIVENLLSVVNSVLPKIEHDDLKLKIINALTPFQSAITLSAISVDEVQEIMRSKGFETSESETIDILQEVSLDIEGNYLNDAIEECVAKYLV